MSSLKLPDNPLLLGGILIAGFWLYSRSAQARTQQAIANRGLINSGRLVTQPYTTPTAVAGQLAGGVVSLIKGIIPGAAKGLTAGGALPGIAAGDTNSRDALRAAEIASNPGYYGWTGPVDGSISGVAGNDGSAYPYVDGLPVASVYDPMSYSNNGLGSFWQGGDTNNIKNTSLPDTWNYWGVE